jgi:hypothetical protein
MEKGSAVSESGIPDVMSSFLLLLQNQHVIYCSL